MGHGLEPSSTHHACSQVAIQAPSQSQGFSAICTQESHIEKGNGGCIDLSEGRQSGRQDRQEHQNVDCSGVSSRYQSCEDNFCGSNHQTTPRQEGSQNNR